MRQRKIDKDKIIEAAKNARSMAEAAFNLNLPMTTFKRNARRLGVYKTNQGGKGWRVPANAFTRESFVKVVLVKNSPRDKTDDNKRLLFKFGLKKEICEICLQPPIWNGEKLVLQLDHINGDRRDNRLENLRIVCPNCHTQTEFFSCRTR